MIPDIVTELFELARPDECEETARDEVR